ncbi:MAG: hypothetical protein KDD29_00125 [Flavobacteriales bacterium]|nr:hypothetical protein [Flavobacteriales bacterium]MCB9335733.1 hypothetical protein [Flavobacteriales bacterium]
MLSREKNSFLYWGGLVLLIISFFGMDSSLLNYILIGVGTTMFLGSQIILFLREPIETFKSKPFLWSIIPLVLNIILDKLSMNFYKLGEDNYAHILLSLMFLIGLITIIRKIKLNERFFWY